MRQKMLREGGAVKRWHTITNVKEQTVAAHSWGVASIVLDLWPDCSNNLIRAALWHDIAELHTGDIPAPIKWEDREFALACHNIEQRIQEQFSLFEELTEKEQTRLKMADILELMWYCLDEIKLGNKKFSKILMIGAEHFLHFRYTCSKADAMCDYLIEKGR